jgi:hypothetical protein
MSTEAPASLAAYCRARGKQLDPRAVICPACGVAQAGVQSVPGTTMSTTGPSKKEPGLAILFSFFFAGAGELYAGDSSTTTIMFMCIAGLAWICAFTVVLIPVTFLCIPVFIYSMVRASRLVKEYNTANGL